MLPGETARSCVCDILDSICSSSAWGSEGQHGSLGPQNFSNAVNAGDWECGQCSFHNFKSRTECRRCGAGR